MRVNFIYERIRHHSDYSGYDQLIRYLGPKVSAVPLQDPFPRRFVWRIGAKFSARSGMTWYQNESFFAELWVIANMIARGGGIYHFLYGEDSYRYAGCFSGLRGNRIVCTYHQPPAVFERVVRSKDHLRRLSGIVALASNQVPYFSSFVGEKKVFLVPHGVDTAFFRPPSIRTGAKTCLFVGQWLRDFATMREVVKLVRAQDEAVRFEIITKAEHSHQFTGLEGVILRSAIEAEDLLALYQTSALLVLPLLDCTASNTILESLACGLPIVTTEVGGVRDYLDESCSYLVPPGDPHKMAEGVLSLLRDDSRREALGHTARQKALGFDWGIVAKKLQEVYEHLT